MRINLVRFCSPLHNENIVKRNDPFLEEINNNLKDQGYEFGFCPKSDFNIIFIETGGVEGIFKNSLSSLKEPIILISNNLNNSLAACLEINSYCIQNRRKSYVLSEDTKTIAKNIVEIINTYKKENKDLVNLGVIGEPSDWLIASKVDYLAVKVKFNISLVDISMNELISEIEKNKYEEIPHNAEFLNKYAHKEELEKAFYIYGALKRLVNKYNLKGLTIRCFDLLERFKSTACLGLAILNEEGIVSGCEGDVPSLISMYLTSEISQKTSFMANPSKIDFKNGIIHLAHCTVPLDMLSSYELDTHFESGIGVAVKGKMKLEEVTLFKLGSDLKRFFVIKGKIKNNQELPGYCRTQIDVQVNPEGLKEYLKQPIGNHVIIVYGDYVEEFNKKIK